VPLPPWTAAHLHAPTSLSDIAVDMAVDSGVRTTEQYLATTRHELAETGSTAATDVFALDRTVAALRDKCFAALRDECTEAERAASAASAAEVDAFVAALTAREPEARPSADEACEELT
jgi:DNA-binding IclR family transcriptional regulator